MSERKDGGPAFPHHDAGDTGTRPGMSLRDWFAGQAIGAIIAAMSAGQHRPNYHVPMNDSIEAVLAADAYEIADALIAQRDKDGQP